jgi:hypothetical protein
VRWKGTKLGEREGTKLGEHCPEVRLSQDRMPIDPEKILKIFWGDYYVRDYFDREKFVAPNLTTNKVLDLNS